MATHCSILGWKIPWTEESGKLQCMGSQKSDMTELTHVKLSVLGIISERLLPGLPAR